MRNWVLTLAFLAVAALAFADKPSGGPPGQQKKQDHPATAAPKAHDDDDRAQHEHAFDREERDRAAAWMTQRYGQNCPPGLAKKNNGCLPPGQAKKRYTVGHALPASIPWTPLPPDLESRLRPVPTGYRYVMVDGDILKLAVGTQLVVDAITALVH